MSSDTPISDLIINKLSYDQYKEVIRENAYNNEQIYEIKDISHTFNTHAGILSNCILEIPQNLKLTLENNVLTLKAGSVLVNSGTTYSTRITTEDYSLTTSSSWQEGRYVIINYGSSWFRGCLIQNTCSGSTDTLSSEPTHIWFDTTTQEVKSFQVGASNYTVFPYPICLIDVVDGVASFAKDSAGHDMIFNGAGFIGHHTFAYPGIKALLPNEFNNDGSLNSLNFISNKLTIFELNTSNNALVCNRFSTNFYLNRVGIDLNHADDIQDTWIWHYIKTSNKFFRIANNNLQEERICLFVKYTYNGTIVTDFTICQPFRADESKKFTYRQW